MLTSTIVSTQLPSSHTTSTSKPKPKMPKVKRKDRTQSIGVPMELRDEEHFYCEKCPRFYKTEWDLKVHTLEHCERVGYKHWKCRRCDAAFAQEVTLREHVAIAHL